MMKKAFGLKLKIFLLIFLASSFLLSFFIIEKTKSQSSCNETYYSDWGYLESPIFDLGTTTNITKFLWKGYVDGGSFVKFILYGGVDSSLGGNNEVSINTPPNVIYFTTTPILESIRYLKYRVELYRCEEYSVPRVDQIYIYYSY